MAITTKQKIVIGISALCTIGIVWGSIKLNREFTNAKIEAEQLRPARKAALQELLSEDICKDNHSNRIIITEKDGKKVTMATNSDFAINGQKIALDGLKEDPLKKNVKITFKVVGDLSLFDEKIIPYCK
ncbi:MAG: hypothetical protein Q7S22_04410 [Candidatus Micrarchaeota archaeon]|nr:hypothetical protein [Candidatus Micrarchaeota archaeon]